MTSVLHKVAVQIGVGVSGLGLVSLLSKELLGAHVSANKLRNALKNLGWGSKLALGGVVALGGGLTMLASLKAPLKAADEWQRATTRFALLGLGDKANAEAQKFAKSMNIIGSSYVDSMNYIREAQGVFRETGQGTPAQQLAAAKSVAPWMAKLAAIDSTLDPEARGRAHTQELAMLRFAEMSGGLTSPKRMQEILDAGFRAITSSGGNVNWESLRQSRVHARAAGFNLSDEALFAKFEPLIGEMKGSAGVALATAYSRLNGINTIMPRSAIDLYGKMGLWDMSKVTKSGPFGRLSFTSNPLKDSALFASDPVAFYERYVRPYYERNGIGTSDRYRDNAILFGGTGGNLFNLIDKQQAVIQRSITAQSKVAGIDPAYAAASKTLAGQKAHAATDVHNMLISIGEQALPVLSRALTVVLPLLDGMTKWMRQHPKQLQAMVTGFIALGGALTVLGTISTVVGVAKILGFISMFQKLGGVFGLVARGAGLLWPILTTVGSVIGGVVTAIAGFVGLPLWVVVGGIIAIGAAIFGVVMAIRHWSTVKKVLGDCLQAVGSFLSSVGKTFGAVFSAVAGGLGSVLQQIIAWFRGLPGRVASGVGHLFGPAPATVPPPPAARPQVNVTVHNSTDIKSRIEKHLGVGQPHTGPSGPNLQHTWAPPGAVPL